MDSQTSQPSQPSRLLSMPLEVLLHISSYLTTPEYGMLRRTSKHLEASFFKPFAREFFTKRQFMLTEFSLQALVDISKSRFADYLSHLIIGLERLRLLSSDPSGQRPQLLVYSTRGEEKYNKYCEAKVSLSESAFHIPQYLEPTVTPVLANLKTLFLDLNDWVPSAGNSSKLKEFLCKAKSLEHLRLNFQGWDRRNHHLQTEPGSYLQLLQWLSGDPASFKNSQALSGIAKPPPDPIKFANLNQIDIGFVNIEPHELVKLYTNYKSTLRSISLHRVTFCQSKDEEKKNKNQWNGFLDEISASGLTLLSAISISNPSQILYANQKRTSKLDIKFEGAPPRMARSWHGSDLEQAVKDFKDSIIFDRKAVENFLEDSWDEGSSEVDSEED
ncbi:putative f-box domain-containing protein [Eutypa lata UCREL1]|uniref:Putative f-box domain-containing protein n=1 Tax=Eutypa lata (strain UCR-EL1) TaxID=1287681 RepID=M7T0E2_EUTLA|nr:putative f-box domain-containing protein [Eutypa lata UCREL1]